MIKAIEDVNAKLDVKIREKNDKWYLILIILCWRQWIRFLSKW